MDFNLPNFFLKNFIQSLFAILFTAKAFYYMVCVTAHWHLPVWNGALVTTSTQLSHSIKCCNPLFTYSTPPSPLYGQLMILYMGKHMQGKTFMFWVENVYLWYNFCCSISVDLYCWLTRQENFLGWVKNCESFPQGRFPVYGISKIFERMSEIISNLTSYPWR